MRRASGLIAAVLIFLMGLGFLVFLPSPILCVCLLVVGGAGIIWQARKLLAEIPDPYDLSKLWEREDEGDEPEDDDTNGEVDTLFCHHCGHAVPRPFARCPDCGNSLR